jgi:hypothetical protein
LIVWARQRANRAGRSASSEPAFAHRRPRGALVTIRTDPASVHPNQWNASPGGGEDLELARIVNPL